jgi:hypothetical protein
MTLKDRISLIDQMINEDPEATIKDYLELVKDLQAIESAASATPVIPITKVQDKRGRFIKKRLNAPGPL